MKRPNILIIYTDQQRWDALGANGNKEIITPNLDKLACEGLNFNHYFVQNPICMPSRISFLTGQYPSTLGITHMGVPVPPETITLPKLIKNYGYVSGNIGKLHFLPHANRDHRSVHPDYGFDHLEISDEPGCYEDAYRAWVRAKAPEQLDHLSLGLPPATQVWHKTMGVKDGIVHPEREPKYAVAFPGKSEFTHSAFVAEQTMDFMEKHANDSWLCVAGFYSPHAPWVAPQEFLDMYDPETLSLPVYPPHVDEQRSDTHFSNKELRSVKHGYYAMITEVDYYVGRLMEKLKELGLDKDTIVVFTSDHGEYLGDHLKYGKGHPGEDCVSRVPFIIRWPQGVKQPGRTIAEIVEAVDVVPTLLESAGIPVPAEIQGRSFKPLVQNEAFAGKGYAIMEFTGWKSIRTQTYRYLCEANGREILYSLEEDPLEYTDVSERREHSEALNGLRKQLLVATIKNEAPLQRIWPY
jgi:arylsulfatase A-like enzyme